VKQQRVFRGPAALLFHAVKCNISKNKSKPNRYILTVFAKEKCFNGAASNLRGNLCNSITVTGIYGAAGQSNQPSAFDTNILQYMRITLHIVHCLQYSNSEVCSDHVRVAQWLGYNHNIQGVPRSIPLLLALVSYICVCVSMITDSYVEIEVELALETCTCSLSYVPPIEDRCNVVFVDRSCSALDQEPSKLDRAVHGRCAFRISAGTPTIMVEGVH
jgi:hypothetical protein